MLRLGRRARVCRGCALAALGAAVGLAAGAAVPSAPGLGSLAAAALLTAAVPLVVPRRPRGASTGAGRRAPKLLTRALPVAIAAGALAQALAAPSAARLGAAVLAILATAWGIRRYRRRGPDREPCDACSEGPPGTHCSGFAPIARRERALSRLAGRWIDAAGAPGVAGPERR